MLKYVLIRYIKLTDFIFRRLLIICYTFDWISVTDKLPSKDDSSQLIYCMATIQEIQRLSCVAPDRLIHSTTRDVEVEGYKLRKGQPFVANLTKFMLDSDVFEDPTHFKQERFIENYGDRALKVNHDLYYN